MVKRLPIKPPSYTELDLGFMVRQLVLCTLPHSDPGDGQQTWSRTSNSLSLTIQPGWDEHKRESLGYPYGSIPRLILFWITTEVQHTKNRTDLTLLEKRKLVLGSSLDCFLREIGLNPRTGGGKRGDAKRLHNQMERLFRARISFEQVDPFHKSWLDMQIAPRGILWWDAKQSEQSWIVLGEEFYATLVDLSVPVDMGTLRDLKHSPLALDLYAWVCYRTYRIVKKHLPPQLVTWAELTLQLGTDYADPRNFRKKAQIALARIAEHYEGLNIGKARGGFTIHASRLAVPESGK